MQQFAKVSDIGVSRIYENSLAWQYCNNEEYMNCLKEMHHYIRDCRRKVQKEIIKSYYYIKIGFF